MVGHSHSPNTWCFDAWKGPEMGEDPLILRINLVELMGPTEKV